MPHTLTQVQSRAEVDALGSAHCADSQSLVRALNSAHAQPGPGYPSALVSLERMRCRLTLLRGGTAYHSRHVPTG